MFFLRNKLLFLNFLKIIFGTQIGIEFRKRPRLLKSHSGNYKEFRNINHIGFRIENNEIKLIKDIDNNSIYNISDIPEISFNLSDISGIREVNHHECNGHSCNEEKDFFINGLESRI